MCLLLTTQLQRYTQLAENVPAADHPCYKDIISEQRMCFLFTIQLQRYTQWAENVLAADHPATKIYSVSIECACCRPPSYKDILNQLSLQTTQLQRMCRECAEDEHSATTIYSVHRECACSSYKDIVSEQRMCLLWTTQLQRYTQCSIENVLTACRVSTCWPATKIYSVSIECACCRPPSYKDILSEHWMCLL